MDGDGEREPHVHPARVELHLGIDELLDPGELHDLVEILLGLAPRQAQNGRIEVHVLPTGEIGVHSRTELEQRSEPASSLHVAGLGRKDASDDLEQRALARAVAPDDAEGLARAHVEGHVAQGPELFRVLATTPEVDHTLLERLVAADGEALGDIRHPDDRHGHVAHSSWAKFPRERAKTRCPTQRKTRQQPSRMASRRYRSPE